MNVVITGVTGLRNRGVEALVTTTVEQLLQRHSDLTINILTETPDYDQIRLKHENVHLLNMVTHNRSFLQKLRAKTSSLYKPLSPMYSLFKDASAVIASGGDLFTSDYPGALRFHLRPLEFALSVNTPIIFLGQSIAFKRDKDAETWLNVAQHAKLITVREKISYNYLTKTLGLSPNLVKHTADSAFLLNLPKTEQVSGMLQSYGVNPNQPIVAVSPSQGIDKFSGCNYEQHLQSWCQLINLVLNELNAQVMIVPHAQNCGPDNDDRIIATHILRSLNFDPRVHIAGADHSASEFKGLISACDMLIAERMHAGIAGLSTNVCTVMIGYSVKFEGIMVDLLGVEETQKGLLISIQQFLQTDSSLKSVIHSAWNRRHEVSKQLSEAIPKAKQSASVNFDLMSKILK